MLVIVKSLDNRNGILLRTIEGIHQSVEKPDQLYQLRR